MIPVSIIIISKNEAEVIAKCIKACKTITTDVIIIDNGSTDGTFNIAERLNCRVFLETWDGYGANKNKGAQYAKYDWILSIDADEIPDDELIEALHQVNFNEPKVAYDIKFRSYLGKKEIKYGNWGHDHRIRLFHRNYVRWSTAKVHETLLVPTAVSIKKLKGHIHHYTANNREECYQKAIYYANLSAEQYLISNKKPAWIKLYCAPIFGLIRNYIFRLGFLDGVEGLYIAMVIYKNTWLKYYYLRQLQRNLTLPNPKQQAVNLLDMEYK